MESEPIAKNRTLPTEQIDDLLAGHLAQHRDQIGDTATTAAIQAAAATPERVLYRRALGAIDLESPDAPAVDATTPFDVASITKSLVGSILAMQAVDENRVHWQTRVADFYRPWANRNDRRSRDVTFLQILNHSSGLPAWRKFYLEHPLDPTPEQARRTRQRVLDAIVATSLEAAPGTAHQYSDLGYLLLGRLLEVLFDEDLVALARRRIFEPLELNHTCYVGCLTPNPRVDGAVVTEDCPLRRRVIRGTVHDENTNIVGGVSTHAGVFSTASDLLKFGLHLLAIDAGASPPNQLVSSKTLRFAWSKSARSSQGHHLAGWDTPSGERSSAGLGFHRDHTIGHLGFTGTSLWIERRERVVSVLLTNRVYPSRENDRIRDLRIAFQEAILPAAHRHAT